MGLVVAWSFLVVTWVWRGSYCYVSLGVRFGGLCDGGAVAWVCDGGRWHGWDRMFEIGAVVWRLAWWRLVWRLAWRVFFFFFWWLLWPVFGFGCCVVSGFGGSMVAGFLWLLWWFLGGSCCGKAVAIVFGGCLVHLDMGWWVLIRVWFCSMSLIPIVVMAVVFGGFFSGGFVGGDGGGFYGFCSRWEGWVFSQWWWWVFP